ncbi:hypothetical protein LTR78_002745 [Recurvomyces mirabilis]|uniref:Uncharacterized protein n=1 Tax=Recurvomyces mirabilis TaxID=574656 RepID=A0AAE0WSV7_9PEZI|nr:hypothetical protein LTR78_002745 [Recurvomyces mirabilis]KAK5159520.1 hypothetical protein LTS14_002662 [Recurvomyces mirabilis]
MPLSNKQMEYLALAWQTFDIEPKIDYTKFAQIAGLASAASARELMRVTKNKLKDEYGALSGSVKAANSKNASGGGAGTPRKTPGKVKGVRGSGRKGWVRGSASVDGDADDGTPTPSQRGKKRGNPAVAGIGGEHGGDDDEMGGRDESPTKKIKKEVAGGGKAKEVDSVMAEEENDDDMWQ